MEDLITGFRKFKLQNYGSSEQDGLMDTLSIQGQDPKYFIISCIDSRSNPGTVFSAKPGIFFSHKAMGAIVRPYKPGTALAAALQFALHYNNVDKIIVLGHTQCGAVKALVEGLEDIDIKEFVSVAKNGMKKAQACCTTHTDILARTEQEVVLESCENLKSYPSVAEALANNKVIIKPWIFDIRTGDLLEHNPTTATFEIISNP